MFLDTERKIWKVKDSEFEVRENVPLSEMRWFKDTLETNSQAMKDGKLTDSDVIAFEDQWDKKVLEVGLGTTYEIIESTGLSSAEYRELIAEVFTFLKAFSTIERAKLSGYYEVKTQKTETKQ